MTFSKTVFAITLTLALSAQAAEKAAVEDKAQDGAPVALVNGVAIPAVYADILRRQRQAAGQDDENMDDDRIRDALIASELLAQEAVKKGLDKMPRLVAIQEYQRKELLGRAMLEQFVVEHPISEETLKAEYEKAKKQAGDKEYRARHILVASEKEAKDLIVKLSGKNKAKFEDLAKKHSKDVSAENGGDLGWANAGAVVPEFSVAMVNLKKGQYTKTPVRTQYGWHVIQLEDVRDMNIPPFEEVRMRIAEQMQKVQLRNYLRELRSAAEVK